MKTCTQEPIERIEAALTFIPPDDRETWVRLGMSVKSELGEPGREIWDQWSQTAESYNAADALAVWRSIKPAGGITIATLFHEAKAHGWSDDAPRSNPSPEELAERQRQAAARTQAEAAKVARERAETAARASTVWSAARPIESDSPNPYLIRKGVAPTATLREIDADRAAELLGYVAQSRGEPLAGRRLVVPVQVDGRLSSLELIDGDGRKTALRGRGTRSGGMWATQRLPKGDGSGLALLIGEGVATVLSASESTGHPAVAALSSGNLVKVAKALRVRYPLAQLVLLADLDKKSGMPDRHAVEATQAVDGALAVPDFGADRPAAMTDFNDQHQLKGLESVREVIETAIAGAERDASPQDNPSTAPELDPFEYDASYFSADDAPEQDESEPAAGSPPTKSVPDGWKLTRTAVFEVKEKKDDVDYVPVCGPLWVIGRTNGARGEWGLVLTFRDHDGRECRPPAIPAERLHEDAGILARELARQGLHIVPGKEKRLLSYLSAWETDRRILSAKRLGWLEDKTGALSFVMPDRVIAKGGTREVVFQPDRYSPTVRTVHASGTLADWQAQVAGPACQHPPMRFALCAGLTPAFLSFAEAGDSFILHFWGKTSRGKTTVGQLAASPWGCAADPNDAPSLTFIRRWNVTGNGLEGLAEAHSDMPLVLDELGSSTIGDIRPLVYQLSGGQGKTALNAAREMREPRSWRTICVSTGELSLHARMADPSGDGTQSRTVKGGLTHRALDIEIDDIAGASPAHEREGVVSGIKIACARHYGTAGPELVRLIAERFETAAQARAYVREQIAEVMADLVPTGLPAETARGARRFALIAVAGEFAANAGLIPVDASAVREATRAIVTAWLGTSAETDEQRIVAGVRAFILKHESRFQRTTDQDVVPNRVGFVDRLAGRWCFTEAGLIEAAPGHDKATIARALRKAGYLFVNEGKLAARVQVGNGVRLRLYAVLSAILDDEEKSAQPQEAGGQGGHRGQAQQPGGLEAVHHPEMAGGQGGHDPVDNGVSVHLVHHPVDPGGQPQTRAVTGRVHGVHHVHPENSVGEFFSETDAEVWGAL